VEEGEGEQEGLVSSEGEDYGGRWLAFK
jgi:hypothetical protein